MNTPNEFSIEEDRAVQWVRFDPDVVNKLSVSEETKRFLITVGLPVASEYVYPSYSSYAIVPSLPLLKDVIEEDKLYPERENLRVLSKKVYGEELSSLAPSFVCLEEGSHDRVLSVYFDDFREGKGVYVRDFLNSSVQQYAQFLLIEHRYISLSGESLEIEDYDWESYERWQEFDYSPPLDDASSIPEEDDRCELYHYEQYLKELEYGKWIGHKLYEIDPVVIQSNSIWASMVVDLMESGYYY